jgi:hypothetical protein
MTSRTKKGSWVQKGWVQKEPSPVERDLFNKCLSDINMVLKRNFQIMTADIEEKTAYSIVISAMLTMLAVIAKHVQVPEDLIKACLADAFKNSKINPLSEDRNAKQ